MEFSTPAVQKCYERIVPLVKEIFGEFASPYSEHPAFNIAVGSAYVIIRINPWGKDDATIQTVAYVVSGAEMTTELMRYLLTQNADLRFGAFGVDSDGDIILHHSIACAACDKDDLKVSAMGLVYYADQIDDEIIAQFGGQRAIDKVPG